MHDFTGKTAFVTGGASGIGLGLAKVFCNAGMKVVIADIRQDHLDLALEQLTAHRQNVHAVQLDVSDRAAYVRAADEAERAFGKVHVLCSNAGVNFFAPIDECTYQDWDWLLSVNLGGVVNGIQTFVPRIKAHGEGGHIVNTGSMASFISGPGAGIYTTSKFAVRGLTECLRWSLAPVNIGVSLLCPGLVNSTIYESDKVRPDDLSQHTGPVDADFMSRLADLHQVGMDPVEVAEKVLHGMRNNDLYIFPHPEFKEELREIFDEVLAAMPTDTSQEDPRRLAFEAQRRSTLAKSKGKMH
jgi:NAD(P)-dependent dehydrogenase (short-subunit alcohol dehydrogenase family)